MRISKLLGVILVIALLVSGNYFLTFALEPYRSNSDEMWQNYDAYSSIDAVYVGSSQAMCAIHPSVIDQALGTVSYNMATNMQGIDNSYDAIETAISDHNISRAILVIDWELMETTRSDNFRAEASFRRAKGKTLPLGERTADTFSFVTDSAIMSKPISLTYFFPWTYNRSSNIFLNMREKMADTFLDEADHREQDGFYPSDEVLDQELSFISFEEASLWSAEQNLTVPTIKEENLDTLDRLAILCEENNVELIVIEVPVPNIFSYYDLNGYLLANQTIEEHCRTLGADFYNFNLLLPDAYPNELTGYKDVGHMNTQGADEFSTFLAKFLKERDTAPASVLSYFREID